MACTVALSGLTSCAAPDSAHPVSGPESPAAPTAAMVTVSPPTVSLAVGASTVLTAVVTDKKGTIIPGKNVTWSVRPSTVATITINGQVTALAAGTAQVTAAVDETSGTALITVTNGPVGSSGEFQTNVPRIDFNVIPARPTSSGITLSLYSAVNRKVRLTLLQENREFEQTVEADTPSLLELNGLAPNRTYRYRIDGPTLPLTGQFRTARAPGSEYQFAIQADSHLDGNSDVAIYANTLRNIVADSGDFLVDLGDTFMSDKYPDFRDAAAQYYAQRYYLGIPGAVMPTYLVQGNHDAENGWNSTNTLWAASQRIRWFPPVKRNDFYQTAVQESNYYAWRWGDALHIALDPYTFTLSKPSSNGNGWVWTLGKAQYDWLTQLLASNSLPYIFIYIHHLVGGKGGAEARGGVEATPFFEWGGANLDGTPGFATQRPGWSTPLHNLFVHYKVSAVFHGHDHLYVNQIRDGIYYLAVPQPSFARENAISSATEYGYLSGKLLGSSGHIRVTLKRNFALVEYVRSRLTGVNAQIADQFEIPPAQR